MLMYAVSPALRIKNNFLLGKPELFPLSLVHFLLGFWVGGLGTGHHYENLLGCPRLWSFAEAEGKKIRAKFSPVCLLEFDLLSFSGNPVSIKHPWKYCRPS